MLTYRCVCGNRLFFGNSLCLRCQRALGFWPESRLLTPLEADENGVYALCADDRPRVKRCGNHRDADCNWLLSADSPDRLCLACRLTQTIPDLASEQNRVYWRRLEAAKRYLICDLVRLGLPVVDRGNDPLRGLAINFLADQQTDTGIETISTGHAAGCITINIAEADDIHREQQRILLGEVYRTLLGHLRHESGHYYWMRLVEPTPLLDRFRALFGDERENYTEAMARYYQNGAAADWSHRHISAYASAHPWEDWAETWAHYLHITDAMETARDFGLAQPRESWEIEAELTRWGELSQALNALSRSLGVADPYPFAIVPIVADKLRFVHSVVSANGNGGRVSNKRPSPSPQASRSATK